MSLISTAANYGGKQPNNTSYIKQFVVGASSLVEWVFKTVAGVTYITPSITNKTILIPQSMIITGNLTVQGTFSNPSDRRLKRDICDIPAATTAAIMQLKPQQYSYLYGNHDMRYGFIAQDVEELLPELVGNCINTSDGEPAKSVDTLSLIPLLVAEIQLLRREVDRLTHAAHYHDAACGIISVEEMGA